MPPEVYSKLPTLGARHLQCFLLFWGVLFSFAMRVNLSLAIVAMTDRKSANPDYVEYAWSEKVRSIVLSSFFWAHMTTQIPGGWLAQRFGGKYVLLMCLGVTSTLTILMPLAAAIGDWPLVCGLRLLQGMAQGVLFPAIHTILAKWSPIQERAALVTYAYSGLNLGTVAMLLAAGFIAASPLGWPCIFYISGGFGLLWCFAWYHWGASTPSEYKNITTSEKDFIEGNHSVKGTIRKVAVKVGTKVLKPLKTPWLKFLTSPAFLSLSVAQCAYMYGFWIILTQIPSYMKNVMGFDIKSNAVLTSLPYLVKFVLSFVFSALSTLVGKKKWLNLTQSRKTFNTIAAWVPAAALASLGYVDARQATLAVAYLIIAVGFSAATVAGVQVNHIDLSPNFAGVLLGSTNLAAHTMSILAPLTVGFVVSEETNVFQWRLAFFIAAGFYFFGNLLFIIFGTAKVQRWNEPENDENSMQELEPIKRETNANATVD